MIDKISEKDLIKNHSADFENIRARIKQIEDRIYRTLASRRLPKDATEEEIIEKIKEIQIEFESISEEDIDENK